MFSFFWLGLQHPRGDAAGLADKWFLQIPFHQRRRAPAVSVGRGKRGSGPSDAGAAKLQIAPSPPGPVAFCTASGIVCLEGAGSHPGEEEWPDLCRISLLACPGCRHPEPQT